MTKIGVYSNPSLGAVAGAIKPYAGDDSEVFETSNIFVSKKTLRFIKHSNIYTPGSLILAVELKTTAGSYNLGVFINNGSFIDIKGIDTNYTLKSTTMGLGAYSEGIHTLDFRLRNIGIGSAHLHLSDVYLVD